MSGETIITVVGNLTAAPELRYTQGGLAVANFTIASTPKVRDKTSGTYVDGEALFLRCSAWREFAENIASLEKGTRVIAQGVLEQRNYETKEGEKRIVIELKVESMGPELRYAKATVSRTPRSSAPANNFEAPTGWNETPAPFLEEAPF
jgi:single-strand DNA-binding protein